MYSSISNVVTIILILFSIVIADSQKPLEWWQSGVIYQIFPRSFKDSDGDGIGDFKGIEEKAEYLKEIGIAAVWLSPIFESPMIDYGYDVSDFYNVASIFGTMQDFRSLKKKLDSLDIKLILDFVPNHSSDKCPWFLKSENRIEPYSDYYVWKDPSGWNNNSEPLPPNNWVSLFNGPAWTYSERRKQFYLHQFAVQQPDLNYRSKALKEEIKNSIRYWLDEGVDGLRMDSVAYMLEHPEMPNEPQNTEYPTSDLLTHESLIHIHSKDWPENYQLVREFYEIMRNYSETDGKSRVMIYEAYTSFDYTMKYYDITDNRQMPFNFMLITDIDINSNARNIATVIHKWLVNMPKNGWANWVIGNHDNSRIASRFGPELVDAMNMLNLLLPGTAITYYGEEIGMTDAIIRWDQTLDPSALNAGFKHYKQFNRDPARTPYQWDSSMNAGFSKNLKTWLPVNSNYWCENVDNHRNNFRSHLNTYKRISHLRSFFKWTPKEVFEIVTPTDWILTIIRKSEEGDLILVIINFGSEHAFIDLNEIIRNESVPTLRVYASSSNSEYNVYHTFDNYDINFPIRPKSALILIPEPTFVKIHRGQSRTVLMYISDTVNNIFYRLHGTKAHSVLMYFHNVVKNILNLTLI